MERSWRRSHTAWANSTRRRAEYLDIADRFHVLEASSHSRRLRPRIPGGHGARRPRLPQGRLAAPTEEILRRLADAHRARQAAARKANYCCSTSRPITSISKRATGWKSISTIIRTRLYSDLARPVFPRRHGDRKIVEIWNKRVHFYTGNYEKYLTAESRAHRAAARPPGTTSGSASSSSKPSSIGSAIRRRKRSRCRAASRSWSASSVSRASAGGEDHPLHVPQPKPSGRIVAEVQGRRESLRRQACLQ